METNNENFMVTSHEFEDYVGDSIDYYQERKARMDSGRSAGFNWCSFLFCGMWLAFRKMYGKAAIVDAALLISCLIPGLGLIIKLVVGFMGTGMYVKSIAKWQGKESALPEEQREAFFNKHKGTSTGMMILFLIIELAIIFIRGAAGNIIFADL